MKLLRINGLKRAMTGHGIAFVVSSVVMCAIAAGCEKDIPSNQSSQIAFNSSIGFAQVASKAQYSGEKFTESDVTYERVEWVEGDEMGILLSNAGASSMAKYKVVSVENKGRYSNARIEASLAALSWSDDGKYDFYAMYPYAEGKLSASGVASFSLPSVQLNAGESKSGNIYVAKANPDYIFMTAGTSVNKTSENATTPVVLPFAVIPTTLQFNISGEAAMSVKNVILNAADNEIAGDVDVAISPAGQEPVCTVKNGSKSVSMAFNNGEPVALAKGDVLSFTLFLAPVEDLTNLSVKIALDYGGVERVVSTPLQDSGKKAFVFEKHCKYVVGGIVVPDAVKWAVKEDVTVTPWTNNPETEIEFEPEEE